MYMNIYEYSLCVPSFSGGVSSAFANDKVKQATMVSGMPVSRLCPASCVLEWPQAAAGDCRAMRRQVLKAC